MHSFLQTLDVVWLRFRDPLDGLGFMLVAVTFLEKRGSSVQIRCFFGVHFGVQKGAKIRILGFMFGSEVIQRHFKSIKRQSFFSAFGIHVGVRKGDKIVAFWRLLR